PRPQYEQRPQGPTAAVSLPSTPEPAARVRLPIVAHPQGVQPSKHCFPLRTTSGKQTKCKSPVRSSTAVVTMLAGLRWDNKLQKQAEASPERYASLLRLFPRSSPEI